MSEEPFECKVCHKSFHNLLNLLGHSRFHSDSFRKRSVQLRNPKRLVLNTVQISIYCSFCGKGFSGKAELLNHLKTHHPNEKIYQCDFCNKSFSQSAISSHMAAHKNEKSFPHEKNQNAETKKNLQITAPREGGATYRHLKTGQKQENGVMPAARRCVNRLVAEVYEKEQEEALRTQNAKRKLMGSQPIFKTAKVVKVEQNSFQSKIPGQIYSKGKKNPKEVSELASSVTKTDLPHVDRVNQNLFNKTDNGEAVSSQPSTSQGADASDASAKLNLLSANSKSLSSTKSTDLPIKKSDAVKQNQVARAAQSKNRKVKPLISQFTIEIATSAIAKGDIFPGDPKPGNHKFIRLFINEDKVKTVSQHVHQQVKSAEKRPENS